MASSLHYAPVSPVDTTSHRESIELERVDSDDGPEAALHSPPPSSPTLPLSHSKIFVSDEQMWKLFFPQFWRWLGTVVIIALMIAALKTFENMDYFSHYWKHLFNIVITGISLALGLNFFVRLVHSVHPHLTDLVSFVGSVQGYRPDLTLANTGQ